jgi:hypothetical protein
MKHFMMILLLLASGLAAAAGNGPFAVTSGFINRGAGPGGPSNFGSFELIGNGFVYSGITFFADAPPVQGALTADDLDFSDGTGISLHALSLTIDGVPWAVGQVDTEAGPTLTVGLSTDLTPAGTADFGLYATFFGEPASELAANPAGCASTCTQLVFRGQGIVSELGTGEVYVMTTPTPSTASLLWIGLAALGVAGRRPRSRGASPSLQ